MTIKKRTGEVLGLEVDYTVLKGNFKLISYSL